MRNHFFLALILLISSSAYAQIETLSDAELGFSPEIAILGSSLKETYNNGFGGTAKFAYNFTDKNFALSFQSGLIIFNGKQPDSINSMPNLLKERYPAMNLVPAKIGARLTFGPGLYAEPQFGATFVISADQYGQTTFSPGFTYAFNVGYHAVPGFDIGARYESVSGKTRISFIGLRVGFAFTFRRQDIY